MNVIRTLAVGGLLMLAAAAPASADSIAYTKDNNIWLANPDGSGQVQITHDGTPVAPYRSPSLADDGTIAAGHGGQIVKLAQSGKLLAQFAPPAATDSTGQAISDVPQQVAISPDGARIAYVYSQPSCPPAAPCGVRQELLYSFSDRTTPVATFGEQTNLTNPSWIDNSRVLAFGGHFRQVNIDSPGGGNDDAAHWFEDAGNEDVGDGELSRQGDRLALVRSYGANTHLAIYHVSAVGGPTPEDACYTGTDASLAGPSWSPDGTKLAFQDSQGIEVMPQPQVVAGDCPGAASSTVILPGASAPDWGPAAIGSDAGTYVAPHDGPPQVVAARLSASLPHSINPRKGIVIRASGSAAGRMTASALLGRRTVASASTPASAGARVTLRLRLGRASLKLLRRKHAKRLTLTVALAPTGGSGVKRSATVRIKGGASSAVTTTPPAARTARA
jgi:Lipoprotein LpqB beta-propeller domain/WD40-like Beta Propeller Repeat